MNRLLTHKFTLLILGILIGVIYGVGTRLVFGQAATLASLTFLFVVPAILGIVPLIFANDAQIRSYRNIIFIPWLTVGSFFVTLLLLRIESVICLLILGAPFFILATVGAFVFRLIRIYQTRAKNTLITIILIPFLLSPVEQALTTPSEIYSTTSEVTINAPADRIWNSIIRVPEIRDSEYTPGVFNALGVPRPIEAMLSGEGDGAMRIGHFQDGLTFVEHITDWEPDSRVSFDITVDPNTIRNEVFDQHVLKGNYFRFMDATYELEPVGENQVRLRLISRYQLTSKINFYGRFWGDLVLKDFQDRLLAVVKKRCEQGARTGNG